MRVIDLGYWDPMVSLTLPRFKRPELVRRLRDLSTTRPRDANGVSKSVWFHDKLVLKYIGCARDAATELYVQYAGHVSHRMIVPYIAWIMHDEEFWGVQRKVAAGAGDHWPVAEYMNRRGVGDMGQTNCGQDKRGRTRCLDYVGGWGGFASYELQPTTFMVSANATGFWLGK